MNIKVPRNPDFKMAESYYRCFMRSMGMDVDSPHSSDTPRRVVKFFSHFTEGLRDPSFSFTAFPKDKRHTYNQLIIVNDIPFYSICAHHHVPFFGKAAVAYLPSKKIIGLSKIVRVVTWKARKPSIQEDLTEQIADMLVKVLQPRAVCVLIKAEHLCISSRGVQQPGTQTITHCLRGQLSNSIKSEFLELIRR